MDDYSAKTFDHKFQQIHIEGLCMFLHIYNIVELSYSPTYKKLFINFEAINPSA